MPGSSSTAPRPAGWPPGRVAMWVLAISGLAAVVCNAQTVSSTGNVRSAGTDAMQAAHAEARALTLQMAALVAELRSLRDALGALEPCPKEPPSSVEAWQRDWAALEARIVASGDRAASFQSAANGLAARARGLMREVSAAQREDLEVLCRELEASTERLLAALSEVAAASLHDANPAREFRIQPVEGGGGTIQRLMAADTMTAARQETQRN